MSHTEAAMKVLENLTGFEEDVESMKGYRPAVFQAVGALREALFDAANRINQAEPHYHVVSDRPRPTVQAAMIRAHTDPKDAVDHATGRVPFINTSKPYVIEWAGDAAREIPCALCLYEEGSVGEDEVKDAIDMAWGFGGDADDDQTREAAAVYAALP